MIRWQERRSRHRKGVSAWTVLLVLFALTGVVGMRAEAAGWIQLTGMAAYGPSFLLLLAVSMQVLAVLRAGVRWLAG
jgi:hypothetical protein